MLFLDYLLPACANGKFILLSVILEESKESSNFIARDPDSG